MWFAHSGTALDSGAVVGWGTQVVVSQSELTHIVATATARVHTLGLRVDGSIVAWGANTEGQCNVPQPNAGFVTIAAGAACSLAVECDQAPLVPQSLAPLNDGVDGDVLADLHCECGWGMTFDVHFGQADPPPLAGAVPARQWALPTSRYGTEYHWQVVAHSPAGAPPGPVWTFRTIDRQPGDLNCDGYVDSGDVGPFVLALADWEEWKRRYGECPELNPDINADGVYGGPHGFGEISPFVQILARP